MRIYIFIIIIILVGIVYFIPDTKKDFFKLYQKNDAASNALKTFYKKPVKTVKVNGIEWKYLTSGNSDKTLLFLHGMGGAYDIWWQQVVEFEKDYKVITYTLPEEIDNLDDAAKGISAILEKEKTDKFSAVGTSMGGYIAQYLLKTMPERLEKVVFGNTFPPNDEIIKENKIKSRIVPLLPEIVIDYLGVKQLKSKLLPAAGSNKKLLKSFLSSLPFSKKGFIHRYYIVVDFFTINPSLDKYKRIPKLIIESDNDPLVSPNLRRDLKSLYSDAEVYTFHNEGHFPYINAADEYNRVLRSFLQK